MKKIMPKQLLLLIFLLCLTGCAKQNTEELSSFSSSEATVSTEIIKEPSSETPESSESIEQDVSEEPNRQNNESKHVALEQFVSKYSESEIYSGELSSFVLDLLALNEPQKISAGEAEMIFKEWTEGTTAYDPDDSTKIIGKTFTSPQTYTLFGKTITVQGLVVYSQDGCQYSYSFIFSSGVFDDVYPIFRWVAQAYYDTIGEPTMAIVLPSGSEQSESLTDMSLDSVLTKTDLGRIHKAGFTSLSWWLDTGTAAGIIIKKDTNDNYTLSFH